MRLQGRPITSGLLALLLAALAGDSMAQRHSSPSDESYMLETDLQALLHDTTISQDKELAETLAWFSKLPSESNCVQLAAMKLMTECKLLDNPSDFAQAHPEWYLDDVKAEYAVKLAICEIVGAQPDHPYPPSQCNVFYPTAEACIKRSWALWSRFDSGSPSQLPCYPESSERHRHQCLKILRNSPQYWTSYSNARFHAVRMCQLSRHAIEREKTLQLHRNLTHITFRLQSSVRNVQDEVRSIHTQLKESFEDMKSNREEMKQSAKQYKQFVQQARMDAQTEREQARKHVYSTQVEIGSVRDAILSNISNYNDQFNAHMNSALTKATAAVQTGYTDTFASIITELQSFRHHLKAEQFDLAKTMDAEIQKHHEKALLAIQIQHGATMESFGVVHGELNSAQFKVNRLNDMVHVLENKTDNSIAKLDLLHHRLDHLGVRFKSIEHVFAILDNVLRFTKIWSVPFMVGLSLFCALMVGKNLSSRRTMWLLLAVFGFSAAYHLLATYHPLKKFQSISNGLSSNPPHPLLEYIKNPSSGFMIVSMAICFLLAISLHKLNNIYNSLVMQGAKMSRAFFGLFGISRKKDDHGNTAYIPTIEVLETPMDAYDSRAATPKPQLAKDHTFARSGAIRFSSAPCAIEQDQYTPIDPASP